jgi:3-phosphoshikimate 1-carboxyvinyltransferase
MKKTISKPPNINSTIRISGDKSISHRAAILNAMAEGTSEVKNFCVGDDQESIIRCLRSLGTNISHTINYQDNHPIHTFTIIGNGKHGFKEPKSPLDCGNSGTCMRLISGLLAGQKFNTLLIGDDSLSKRPMNRIANPLKLMGTTITPLNNSSTDEIMAPFEIKGSNLNSINYKSPVSSAQVKSCILIAGAYAKGITTITEPSKSRDHTERMMKAMGAEIEINDKEISIKNSKLKAQNIVIPGDISSAAFWIILAACHKKAELLIPNIGLNPTRTGILEVLTKMGANINISNQKTELGEPRGDLIIKSSNLKGITIEGSIIPKIIDEIPILSLAACFASGETIIKDAQELRVKESDRIKATVQELFKLGANISETKDGMIIKNSPKLNGSEVNSHGDHRIAMMLGISGLLAEDQTTITNAEAANISYPDFWDQIDNF